MSRARRRDLRFDRRAVAIPAVSAKARREQEAYLLGALETLREARARRAAEPDDALVFPPRLMPNARTMQRDLKAADIPCRDPSGAVVDFHSLRVTLATRLCDANVPLVRA